ncbi:nitroreductase family protein [Maribacter sp. TH_r10]|uniref:nitroreductase family protein n=1 Tax=Maribacter sp. TH_r10 TaxID=3082086 RepID=UPI002954BEA5|nr:nitroreductase family protein [Maribacter sp. TH_r10]MDV7139008.1 nitroreductase family protein [Maribacter sp. TH_r10]
MEKTVTEAIAYRRSVRIYKEDIELNDEIVRKCLLNASLAPTSSNMQLWEFYHVTDKTKLKALSKACFDQPAAKTAKQLVVVVTRKDLWRKRSKANLDFLKKGFEKTTDKKDSTREKFVLNYYKKLIPTLYTEFLGIIGALRFIFFQIVGLFRPIYRQVRKSDMRIVAHKSAALAAQNFMISMSAVGYDTCPMEGSDTLRIKRILDLPRGAEINMVIACGVRDDKGVYGPRFRIPFEEVYHKV